MPTAAAGGLRNLATNDDRKVQIAAALIGLLGSRPAAMPEMALFNLARSGVQSHPSPEQPAGLMHAMAAMALHKLLPPRIASVH